jgi:hypothetical protein
MKLIFGYINYAYCVINWEPRVFKSITVWVRKVKKQGEGMNEKSNFLS